MDRTVVRKWQDTGRQTAVLVFTIHPQVGELFRGTIRPAASDDWRGRWRVQGCDWYVLGENEQPVAGDYLDAERVLLDATAGMDELVPDDELSED